MWRSDPPPQQAPPRVPAAALTTGDQPPRTTRGFATLLSVVAMAWPQVNEPRPIQPLQGRSQVAPLTLTYGDHPGPSQAQGAVQQARLASSWIAVWTAQSAAPGADRDIGAHLQPAVSVWVANTLTSTGGASTTGETPFAPKRIKIPGYQVGATQAFQPALTKELQKLQRAQANSDTVIIQRDYELMVIDRMLLVDTSIGDVLITLLPAKIRFELPLTIAKISPDSNNVIVHAAKGEKINDSGGLQWTDSFVAYSMHPDGDTHWWLEGVNERIVKLSPGTYTKVVINENGRAIAGSTTIEEQDIVLQDIVTNNTNTTRHGFMPKLNGDGTYFLNGLGQWVKLL